MASACEADLLRAAPVLENTRPLVGPLRKRRHVTTSTPCAGWLLTDQGFDSLIRVIAASSSAPPQAARSLKPREPNRT